MAKDKTPEKRDPWVPLRQSYPQSERISAVSPLAECLFLRLLTLVDDQSAFFADAQRLRCLAFPLRAVTVTNTARVRDELVAQRLVRLYGDGQYLVIVNPKQFHRSDVKADIRFPPPPQGDTESVTNAGRTRHESGSPYAYAKEQTKEQEKQPSSPGGDKFSPGFEKWWAAYPKGGRKKGKPKCWAKWKREKLEERTEDILACLEAAKRSRDWRRDGGQYIQGPHPWLNSAPWLTEDFAKDAADGPVPSFTPKMRSVTPDDMWQRLDEKYRQAYIERAERLLADRAPPKGRDHWPRPLIVDKAQELWWADRLRAGNGKEQQDGQAD